MFKWLGKPSIARGVSFAGTLVVLLGALVAATIIAVTISKVYGTLVTRPHVMVSESYYLVNEDKLYLHALFYNVGQGNTRFRYLRLYIPISINNEKRVNTITVYGNTSVFNETGTPQPIVNASVNFGSRVKYVELIIEEGPRGTAYTGRQYYTTRLRFHLITGEIVEMTLNLTNMFTGENIYPAPSIVRYIYFANGTIVKLFDYQRYRQSVRPYVPLPYKAILKPGDIIEIHIDSPTLYYGYDSNYYDGYIPLQIAEYGLRGYQTFDFINKLMSLLYNDRVFFLYTEYQINLVFHNVNSNTTIHTQPETTIIWWFYFFFYLYYESFFVWDEEFLWNGSLWHNITNYRYRHLLWYPKPIYDVEPGVSEVYPHVWEGYINPLIRSGGDTLYMDISIPLPEGSSVNAEDILGLAVFDREVVPVFFKRTR